MADEREKKIENKHLCIIAEVLLKRWINDILMLHFCSQCDSIKKSKCGF